MTLNFRGSELGVFIFFGKIWEWNVGGENLKVIIIFRMNSRENGEWWGIIIGGWWEAWNVAFFRSFNNKTPRTTSWGWERALFWAVLPLDSILLLWKFEMKTLMKEKFKIKFLKKIFFFSFKWHPFWKFKIKNIFFRYFIVLHKKSFGFKFSKNGNWA